MDAVVAGVSDLPIKELNDRYLATSLGLAAELLVAEGRVSKLVVMLEDDADADVVRGRLTDRLRESDSGLAGKTWEELAVFYRQVRLLYAAIFGFMGAVLVVVVVLAAANTMMMAVAERLGFLRVATLVRHIKDRQGDPHDLNVMVLPLAKWHGWWQR